MRRYPDGLAWQFNVPKKVLRKQPEFKKFHSFLVFETETVCPNPRTVSRDSLNFSCSGEYLETGGC